MTNLILLLISFFIFISYLTYVVWTVGITKSVSDSVYKVKQPILFILTMMTMPIPMMIVGSTPLMFFAGAFICFVGAAPCLVRIEMEERVHVIGATGGILLGMISVWIDLHMAYASIGVALFTLYTTSKWNKIKNHTWWIEVVAFIVMFWCLFIRRVL